MSTTASIDTTKSTDTSDQHVDDLIPLLDSWFYILWALADGAYHGYAIITYCVGMEKTRVKMGTGIIYRALPRMIEAGLIEKTDAPEDDAMQSDGRRRIYYQLTHYGVRALNAHLRFLDDELTAAAFAAGKLPKKESL